MATHSSTARTEDLAATRALLLLLLRDPKQHTHQTMVMTVRPKAASPPRQCGRCPMKHEKVILVPELSLTKKIFHYLEINYCKA
jgi:hypothetical protein